MDNQSLQAQIEELTEEVNFLRKRNLSLSEENGRLKSLVQHLEDRGYGKAREKAGGDLPRAQYIEEYILQVQEGNPGRRVTGNSGLSKRTAARAFLLS